MGQTNGAVPFDRLYSPNTQAALTAPATANGKAFMHWNVNGTTQEAGKKTVKVNMASTSTATAVYEN